MDSDILSVNTIFEAFSQSSRSGFIATDAKGYPIFINPAASRMTGFELAEIQGKPLQDWLCYPASACVKAAVSCPIAFALQTLRAVQDEEVWFVRNNGAALPVRCSVTPLTERGRLRGSILDFQDITAEQKARDAFRNLQAQAALEAHNLELRTASLKETADQLETFCYTIAHDLRAPLRAQLGYANLILEDYGLLLDDNARHCLHKIIASARYQDRLTSDLLAYARVSREELEFEPVDLGKVITLALDTFSEQIKTARATILKQGPFPTIYGHELTLRLAIENLISNSLKYVRPEAKPRLKFRSTVVENVIRLWIEDNGIGIAPEHQEQIFNIFQRLHGQDKFSGTGIGLALVRKAIHRMNGRVGLESELGRGTRFWIDLPKPVMATAA